MRSARRPPAAGELHVWRVELPATAPRPAARRARASILAAYLGGGAGRGGGEGAGGDAAVGVSGGEDGKPRLAVAPERLSFNLSHSGGLALVAIAPGGVEVGVDLERLRPRRDFVRLARRWLPSGEADAVAGAEEAEREAAFYAAWTRHEARVKCAGTGLAGPAPGDEVLAYQLPIDPGYAAAVAIDGATQPAEPHIKIQTWTPQP